MNVGPGLPDMTQRSETVMVYALGAHCARANG